MTEAIRIGRGSEERSVRIGVVARTFVYSVWHVARVLVSSETCVTTEVDDEKREVSAHLSPPTKRALRATMATTFGARPSACSLFAACAHRSFREQSGMRREPTAANKLCRACVLCFRREQDGVEPDNYLAEIDFLARVEPPSGGQRGDQPGETRHQSMHGGAAQQTQQSRRSPRNRAERRQKRRQRANH